MPFAFSSAGAADVVVVVGVAAVDDDVARRQQRRQRRRASRSTSAAGTISQTARGGFSSATKSASESAPVAPSPASALHRRRRGRRRPRTGGPPASAGGPCWRPSVPSRSCRVASQRSHREGGGRDLQAAERGAEERGTQSYDRDRHSGQHLAHPALGHERAQETAIVEGGENPRGYAARQVDAASAQDLQARGCRPPPPGSRRRGRGRPGSAGPAPGSRSAASPMRRGPSAVAASPRASSGDSGAWPESRRYW